MTLGFQGFKPFASPSPATSSKKASASVVDGKLILSLPDALKPVLWQMDLVPARASALEIDDAGEGRFALLLKAPKAETTTIAVFADREAALSALMAASAALERAHGQIRGGESQPKVTSSAGVDVPAWTSSPPAAFGTVQTHDHQSAMRWIAGIAGIVLLGFLLNTLWTLSPRPPASMPSAPSASGTSAAPLSDKPPPDAVGVPLSADEVLGRP